jgi:cell division septum initiation protein DivIVA
MESLSGRISKRDFPLAKRGYEPNSVNAYIDSIGRSVAALEEELAVVKAKAEKLETRLRGKSDADTVVQTAFLAAAEAKSKLLQEAEQRAAQMIAEAEARSAAIAAASGFGFAASTDDAHDLDSARSRAQQIEADAIRLLEEARREAESIVAEARRIADATPEPATHIDEQVDEAREELHRLVWLVKTVKEAVATGIGAAEAQSPELALVLDDAADLAEVRPIGERR